MAIMTRCCCCDVRIGSIVVAIWVAISSGGSLIQSACGLAGYSSYSDNSALLSAAWGASVGINSLMTIAAICLFIGVLKDTKSLLIPYMIGECLYMVAYVALEIAVIVVLVNGNYIYFDFLNLPNLDEVELIALRWALIGIAVGIPIALAIDILCLLCVISQYQELRDGRGRGVPTAPSTLIIQQGYSTGFAPVTYDPKPTVQVPIQQYYEC
ncbi:uncharacterized protein LOC110979152 [Acanthaster planci]|uniref:Uncharacterized protein LOC110979152 n=1 Tax=Acanthaster planci TaxID=133434 RepID=A0A8B7YFI0_ACAPL|nr:uncharacterized protein LOC110979152 [Acanthaster planci]